MKFLKRLLAGMGIGVGAAIPGVSGAAIAVIFRVYEDIIDAVNNFRKKFGHAILVLIPILLGVALAVIPCIYLFSLAFEHLMFVLICIFAGFLIGSFPSITEKVKGIKPNKLQIALIITGAGEKSFVAGADIAEMSKLTKEQGKQFSKKGNDVFRKIETFPIPVIAAVNGFTFGDG